VLTVLNGKIVHAAGEFSTHAPSLPPVMPDWSPVASFGGYGAPGYYTHHQSAIAPGHIHTHGCGCQSVPSSGVLRGSSGAGLSSLSELWGSGCDCFAF